MKDTWQTKIYRLFSKRKLRFELLSSFIVLQIITVLCITTHMYHTQKASLLETSASLMNNISTEKIESILNRFEGVATSVTLGSHFVADIDDANIQNNNLVKYIAEYVKKYYFTESIFVSLKNGRFMQVKVLAPRTFYRTVPNKYIPKNATLAVRILDFAPDKKSEVWYYIDNSFNLIDKESLPESEVTLNFFTREWYTNGVETESFNWSSIYIFSTTQLPGIAGSYPIRDKSNKVIGVIGSDIHLKNLSDILQNMTFEGTSLIVNDMGEIIAHPTIKETAKVLGAEVKLLSLEALPEKLLFTAYDHYKKSKNDQVFFSLNNSEYISRITDFKTDLFRNWKFLTVAATDVFIGAVKDAQKKVLLISILILLVSTFFISYITLRISRPIHELVAQTERIRMFDLTPATLSSSSIVEIQKLQEAMGRMRRSLETFGKFLPKNLVRMLIEKDTDVHIGGKKRRVTIFFSDIEGFTSISESSAADKLMLHLSEYFDEMSHIILNEMGTIDKYIGDAIMAFWGAPNADMKHGLHACKAALFCQKRLLDLNRKWIFDKKPAFNTRIGLHTGDAIVGNLGSSERMNYTIIGDSVNLASRLEGVNKNYGTYITISEQVYKEIAENAVVRPLDIVAVKGKEEGVPIYELIALTGTDPYLLPTNDELDLCHGFQAAFKHYCEQRWDDALEILNKLALRFPNDTPIQMYIKRCNDFKVNSPGKNWDKVYHLKEK